MSNFGITTGLDQPLAAGVADDPEWRLLSDRVDRAFDAGGEVGSLEPVFDLANQLIKGAGLNVLAFAKLIYTGWQMAEKFGLTEDAFIHNMFIRTGVSGRTLYEYLCIWEDLFSNHSLVPAEYRPRLMERQVGSLRQIRKIVNHKGGKVGKRLWKRIVRAEDHKAIVAISKEVREIPPGKGAMSLVLERSTGTLTAWQDGHNPAVLGFLRCTPEDLEDPLRRRAFNYIKEKLHIQEQV